MLPPSFSSFIFLLMFPSLLVSLPPPVSLSVKSTSAFCFGVYAAVHMHAGVSLCVSLRVGVGDKADSQHHRDYKAPRTLSSLALSQLRTISRICACASVCVRVCVCCERENASERGTEGSGCTLVELRAMKSGISSGSRFVSRLFRRNIHCHQKIPPKTHRGR